MMFALVVIAGKAFAQPSKYTPTVGSTWTYTINGLTTATDAALTLNGSTTVPTADTGLPGGRVENSGYTIETASTFDNPGNSVSIEYNWLVAGTYNLWVVVDNGTCTNMAFQQIVVSANDFNAELVIAGISTNAAYQATAWTDDDEAGPVCPVDATGMNYDIDGPFNDGSSYLYARVSKTGDNDGTWNFTVTAADASTIEYYDGTDWQTGATFSTIPDATVNVLVRFTVANIPAGYNTFDASIVATEDNGASTVPDNTLADDDDAIVISATPDMSGVTFN